MNNRYKIKFFNDTEKEFDSLCKANLKDANFDRLVELIIMAKTKPIKEFGWSQPTMFSKFISASGCSYYTHKDTGNKQYYYTRDEIWNHPITQKAWTDELVKVVKELSDTDLSILMGDDCLEQIFDKYGRSINNEN